MFAVNTMQFLRSGELPPFLINECNNVRGCLRRQRVQLLARGDQTLGRIRGSQHFTEGVNICVGPRLIDLLITVSRKH